MGAEVFLTVGMNPVPVLVGAYRLYHHFQTTEGAAPRFTVICSTNSQEEARAVKRRLQAKLGPQAHVAWQQIQVDPADLEGILTALRAFVSNSQLSNAIHLHYTGGTKAMAAHTMQCLVEIAEGRSISTSYLEAVFGQDQGGNVFRNCNGNWQLSVESLRNSASLGKFIRFLSGDALEYYVFEELNELLADPVRHSFKARQPSAVYDCEVDLVACLGYQLLAVSCTEAAKRALLKGRGFEVWHRARQIGGDGARAILLCPSADSGPKRAKAAELEADLAYDIGLHDQAGRRLLPVRVFGFKDMEQEKLKTVLRKYLNEELRWSPLQKSTSP